MYEWAMLLLDVGTKHAINNTENLSSYIFYVYHNYSHVFVFGEERRRACRAQSVSNINRIPYSFRVFFPIIPFEYFV